MEQVIHHPAAATVGLATAELILAIQAVQDKYGVQTVVVALPESD